MTLMLKWQIILMWVISMMILEKMTNYTVTASYILEVEINCFGVAYINMYVSMKLIYKYNSTFLMNYWCENNFVRRWWSVSHAEAHACNLSSTSVATIVHMFGLVAASGKTKERKGSHMFAVMDMENFRLHKVRNEDKERESLPRHRKVYQDIKSLPIT